jgi:glucokinase
MNATAIGIDLGGTRIKGVVIDAEGRIIAQRYYPVEGDNWKQVIIDTVEELRSTVPGHHLVGISAPGIPDEENSCIAHMPGRLQGLERLLWNKVLGTNACVANDAIAAMAAEARFGAAKNTRHAVLMTLGTGVGGAILMNGQIYQGAFQKAGHAGHISVDHEGEPDITGMPGSLEDAIGNCTIQKRSLGRYNDTHDLVKDYQKGDYFAQWVWLSSIRKLSIAIASITNLLSPEMIILGGGITEAGDLLFKPLRQFLSLYEWRAGGQQTTVLKTEFGDLAGAIGAAGFAMMKQDILKKEI